MARKRLARWYAAANRRRGELIYLDRPLTAEEEAELQSLQRRCGEEVERVFPAPPMLGALEWDAAVLALQKGK